MIMVFISKDDPYRARVLIDALSDKTRLEILKLLMNNPTGMTAAQIARILNKTIPTILSHLEILTEAGILRIDYTMYRGRALKLYSISEKEISVEIDLQKFVWIPLRSYLDLWVSQYIKIKRETDILPSKVSAKDIAKILGIDERTAVHIKEQIENNPNWLSSLVNEALQILSQRGFITIADLSKSLSIARIWAKKLAELIVQQGYAYLKDDTLYRRF